MRQRPSPSATGATRPHGQISSIRGPKTQRTKDAYVCLAYLDGSELALSVQAAVRLDATVVVQDLEEESSGIFLIARRVAKDRVISTVDPGTSHGHKT